MARFPRPPPPLTNPNFQLQPHPFPERRLLQHLKAAQHPKYYLKLQACVQHQGIFILSDEAPMFSGAVSQAEIDANRKWRDSLNSDVINTLKKNQIITQEFSSLRAPYVTKERLAAAFKALYLSNPEGIFKAHSPTTKLKDMSLEAGGASLVTHQKIDEDLQLLYPGLQSESARLYTFKAEMLRDCYKNLLPTTVHQIQENMSIDTYEAQVKSAQGFNKGTRVKNIWAKS